MKELNVKEIREIMRIKKIKKPPNITKKQEIIDYYISSLAAITIQRKYRLHLYSKQTDSITFDTVSFPCFIWKPVGSICSPYFYNYYSIINYIIKSGDTRDPITRVQYTDDDLKRLDEGAKKAGFKYKSTLKIKHNPTYIIRIRNRENEIRNYELRLNEIKQSIKIGLDTQMLEWEYIGPLFIENVNYSSPYNFIYQHIREYNIIIQSLNNLSRENAEYYKDEMIKILESVPNPNSTKIFKSIIN
jgi:hypothetical protein